MLISKLNRMKRAWLVVVPMAILALAQSASAQFYQETNLVSDVPGLASFTDTNLVGAWGITRSPASPWWVNSTLGGVSLLFDGAGQPFPTNNPLVVAIPPVPATATAIAFNGGSGFQVQSNKPAIFIFTTLNGTISGWNPGQTNRLLAVLEVDNSGKAGYTGLTIAQRNGADFLYAANYLGNKIEVFDTAFNPVVLPSGAFADADIPDGLSVFNVQSLKGALFVTYAPTNVFGNGTAPGQGFVDVFDPDGTLLGRLKHGRWMDAPWGVTLAPANFGHFSDKILVGMFGSGQIAAFDTKHGNFHGLLEGADGLPLTIGTGKGLWGLDFGNGATAGPTNALYFASDVASTNGFHGIFGAITPLPPMEDSDEDRGGDQ